MNKIVSHDLWDQIEGLSLKAKRKRAAVAYVTCDDVIKFGAGDLLVVDASDHAVASGQTSAGCLSSARSRGAEIRSLPGLHAKIILLGGYAVIGSSNISRSSMDNLIEAALITDSPGITSMVGGLISKLQDESTLVDDEFIKHIISIEVDSRFTASRSTKNKNTFGSAPEYRSWVVNVVPLSEELVEKEAERIKEGEAEAEKHLSDIDSEVDWIRFIGKSTFRRDARPNDQLILIWSDRGKDEPSAVFRHQKIIYRQDEPSCTRFFLENPSGNDEAALNWDQFLLLTDKVGIKPKVGSHTVRRISNEDSEAIFMLWPRK